MLKAQPLIGCTTYPRPVSYPEFETEAHGLLPAYTDPLVSLGAIPILIPLNLGWEGIKGLLPRLDGIYIPGGGDIHPQAYGGNEKHPKLWDTSVKRDTVEHWVIHEALERDMPLLGICRGHQMLNVAMGGSLWEDIDAEMPDAIEHTFFGEGHQWDKRPHTVNIEPDSNLAELLGTTEIEVNSLHHQGVCKVGDGLTVTATSDDGLPEAFEIPTQRFVLSVQWHPEHLLEVDSRMCRLFEGFLEAI